MPPTTVSRTYLAKLFACDVRTIKNLVDEGMPKEARGQYDLTKCVPWYIEREREQARAGKGLNDLDLARQRKTIAEARKAEMEAEALEGRLIPLDVHEKRFGDACERLRAVLTQVPARFMGRIQQARADAEAQAVGEAIRDETLKALLEVADDLDDDDGAGASAA